MAAKTNSEKIDELATLVAVLSERLDAHRTEVGGIADVQSRAVEVLAEVKTEIALLKKISDDLVDWKDDAKRLQEERGRKLWLLVPAIIAAILSSALTAVATYFLRK
jgi:hypothetical protein